MKKVLVVLVAVLAFGTINSQELKKDVVDEFTGSVKKITNSFIVGKSGDVNLSLAVLRINESRFISVYANFRTGCSGARDNSIIFKFTDGTVLTLTKDLSKIECSERAVSLYSITGATDLSEKDIEKIRFTQSKGYMDFTTSGLYTVSQLIKTVK